MSLFTVLCSSESVYEERAALDHGTFGTILAHVEFICLRFRVRGLLCALFSECFQLSVGVLWNFLKDGICDPQYDFRCPLLQVAKYWKHSTKEEVAIKIQNNEEKRAQNITREIEILCQLRNGPNCHIVQALDFFSFKNHICIVFELLQQSLYDFQANTPAGYIPLKFIRPIAWQIVVALDKLKYLGIIHADLKMDNIMLIGHPHLPFMVKLIDLGCARPVSKDYRTRYLQNRFNRAPEIFLGLSHSEAIDMWSLGCVMAKLFLGEHLFDGQNVQEVIRYIHKIIGPFPRDMLHASTCPADHRRAMCCKILAKKRKFNIRSLSDMVKINKPVSLNEEERSIDERDRYAFISLLGNLLCFDQVKRFTPRKASEDIFFSFQYLIQYRHTTSYQQIFQAMDVIRRSASAPYDYFPGMQSEVQFELQL